MLCHDYGSTKEKVQPLLQSSSQGVRYFFGTRHLHTTPNLGPRYIDPRPKDSSSWNHRFKWHPRSGMRTWRLTPSGLLGLGYRNHNIYIYIHIYIYIYNMQLFIGILELSYHWDTMFIPQLLPVTPGFACGCCYAAPCAWHQAPGAGRSVFGGCEGMVGKEMELWMMKV